MPIQQALALAEREGLDLVEIQAGTKPPVCSILDYSKLRFEKSKEKKQKTITQKEIRLRPVSNDHDVEIKINQLKKFLEEKRTVLVSIVFSYREMHHKDQGFKIVNRIIEAVQEMGKVEQSARFEGKRLTARIAPLPPKSSGS